MTPFLAALLVAGAPEPVQVDLATLEEHALELDGKWVEFEAYVALVDLPGPERILMAVPGETLILPDGRTVLGCSNEEEANFPVLPRDGLLGPLRRGDLRKPERFVGAVVRARFRNKPFFRHRGGVDIEWGGRFESAVIRRATGKYCLSHPPEGALPLPPPAS